MRLNTDQLDAQLARELKPLYAIYGEEVLLAVEAADRIRKHCVDAGFSDRQVLSVESGFDWSQLLMSGNSLSLFGSRRLLELRIPSGKPGNEGAETLRKYVKDLPPDVVTLITLPKLDNKQVVSDWFKALDAAGAVVAAQPVALSRLPQWLTSRFAQQNQQIDDDALRFLVSRVEGNLLAAHQEVQKLGLLFPGGKLTLAQVEEAVMEVARYDVFQLGAALLAGDNLRFVRMLDGLRGEGTAPPLVLWSITEEARALLHVTKGLAARRQLQQLLREARVWGPRADLMPRALKRISERQLEDALLQAAEIDRAVKGLAKADVWDALLQLGLALTGGGQQEDRRPQNRGRIAERS